MDKETLKKIAAATLLAGSLAGGVTTAALKEHCDYTVPIEGKEVCLTEAEVAAVKASVESNTWESLRTWND
ncbi:hypothetical protein KW797_00505 [Candidatus Parcubacteria bacterium]|nr:hypothetical protein [Candidatus Parcubacteria bacterium]